MSRNPSGYRSRILAQEENSTAAPRASPAWTPNKPPATRSRRSTTRPGDTRAVASSTTAPACLTSQAAASSVDGIDRTTTPIPVLTAIAQRYTGEMRRPAATVIDAAHAELHALTTLVDTTVR
ncbi:hypothetical protein GCM10027610_054220 [Dactylosporangium cerinum]